MYLVFVQLVQLLFGAGPHRHISALDKAESAVSVRLASDFWNVVLSPSAQCTIRIKTESCLVALTASAPRVYRNILPSEHRPA